MVMKQCCIYVDYEILEQFKQLYPNQVSSYLNQQLKLKVDTASANVEGIDLVLTRKKLEEINKKADEFNLKRTELREKLRLAEENQAKTAEEKLLLEKERILNAKKCGVCGQIIEDRKNNIQLTPTVVICKACYDPGNPKVIALLKA